MTKENLTESTEKDYNFTGKDPNAVLAPDEIKHFDEGMALKNTALSENQVDFARGVESVVRGLDKLLP